MTPRLRILSSSPAGPCCPLWPRLPGQNWSAPPSFPSEPLVFKAPGGGSHLSPHPAAGLQIPREGRPEIGVAFLLLPGLPFSPSLSFMPDLFFSPRSCSFSCQGRGGGQGGRGTATSWGVGAGSRSPAGKEARGLKGGIQARGCLPNLADLHPLGSRPATLLPAVEDPLTTPYAVQKRRGEER